MADLAAVALKKAADHAAGATAELEAGNLTAAVSRLNSAIYLQPDDASLYSLRAEVMLQVCAASLQPTSGPRPSFGNVP